MENITALAKMIKTVNGLSGNSKTTLQCIWIVSNQSKVFKQSSFRGDWVLAFIEVMVYMPQQPIVLRILECLWFAECSFLVLLLYVSHIIPTPAQLYTDSL